jgi:phosphoribosylformylglycinamidine synthase
MIRALVLRTAGTNCDGETVHALELAGARADLTHVARVVAEPQRFDAYSLLVLPGGFSYGDDIAAGRVLGFEMRHHLGEQLERFVARGGYVLGVCNGFQALVDTGLLEGPGQGGPVRSIALAANASGHYECRWVTLKSEASACTWLDAGALWPVPVAHGEGRFVVRDARTLARMKSKRQIALRYVSADGSPARGYPDSPNASIEDIAGVCDETGRVLGLMPHPERNITPWHHPQWTRRAPRAEGEGLAFYRRMVEAAAGAP